MAHQVSRIPPLERPLAEASQLVEATLQPRRRRNGDVVGEDRLQPYAFARLRVDEEQCSTRAARVERMLDVRPHDDAAPLAPFAARWPYRRGGVEAEKNLDRMLRVGRHLPPRLGDHQKAALPQVPAWHALPGGSGDAHRLAGVVG